MPMPSAVYISARVPFPNEFQVQGKRNYGRVRDTNTLVYLYGACEKIILALTWLLICTIFEPHLSLLCGIDVIIEASCRIRTAQKQVECLTASLMALDGRHRADMEKVRQLTSNHEADMKAIRQLACDYEESDRLNILLEQRVEQYRARLAKLGARLSEACQCNICYDALSLPVVLPVCGHSFCGTCVEQWMKSRYILLLQDPLTLDVRLLGRREELQSATLDEVQAAFTSVDVQHPVIRCPFCNARMRPQGRAPRNHHMAFLLEAVADARKQLEL